MAGAPRVIVLVPGAWHGAWCWSRLAPLLRAAGHEVLTPELAGAGGHGDPATATLDGWAKSVLELTGAGDRPVTLVGHSRGGVVISRAAELAPDRVERLVYLAGYLLPTGGHVAGAARADESSLIAPHMIPARAGVSCHLRDDVVDEAFYNDCDAQTRAWARSQLREEPLKPLVTPMRVTAARFGQVPRMYVECARDRTVSLAAQRRMQSVWPCDPVITLDAGHSPFLSQPQALARGLLAL